MSKYIREELKQIAKAVIEFKKTDPIEYAMKISIIQLHTGLPTSRIEQNIGILAKRGYL